MDDMSVWAGDCIVSLSIVQDPKYPYKPDSKDLAYAIHNRDREIEQLRARVAELEADAEKQGARCNALIDLSNQLDKERREQLERADKLEKDRERLDWLERTGYTTAARFNRKEIIGWYPPNEFNYTHIDDLRLTLRSALDDAMKNGEG